MTEDDNALPPVEEQLVMVKKYVKMVTARHAEWDADDLEGLILENLLRWPPKTRAHVSQRCYFSTQDWHAKKLGGKKKKPTYDNMVDFSLDYQLTPTITNAEVIAGDPDVIISEDRRLSDELLCRFKPDVQVMLILMSEGLKMQEVADYLGTSKASVSRGIASAKPLLAKMLGLEYSEA